MARSSKQQRSDQEPGDTNQWAANVVAAVTGEPPPTGVYNALLKRQATKNAQEAAKNPAAVALGRLGGLKGGKARAAALTPKQRSQIARVAAKRRWQIQKEADDQQKQPSEIAKLAQQGLTSREIEAKLGLPKDTVNRNSAKVRVKLATQVREERERTKSKTVHPAPS